MRISKTSWAAALSLAAILGVGLRFYLTPERALRNAAEDRRSLALETLGAYLAQRHAGDRILVVGNPFVQRPGQPGEIKAFEKAAVRGLRRGVAGRLEVAGIAYPALAPKAAANPAAVSLPPNATTPLSFMTAPDAWDRLRREHPAANLWVSLIGLPVGVARMAVWKEPVPRFALFLPDLRILGGTAAVRAAFRSGKLVAMVLNRPGAPPQSAAPVGDARAEFNRRFLLVTPENCEAALRQYPGLF